MRKNILTFFIGLAAAASAAAPTGIANVFGAESWLELQDPPYGMYNIPMDGSAPALISDAVVPANLGSVYVDGRYFVIEGIVTSSISFITNYIYDALTWEKITDFRGENITAFDMAWDEVSGKVYGYFHNFDDGSEFFGTIDVNTGTTARISSLPFVVRAMSFDSERVLYAISASGALYTIDTATGATEHKADLGCPGRWTTSGAIDSATRTFYYVACNDASTIYHIDLDTFAVETAGNLAGNMGISGLYFTEPGAAPKAPAAPSLTLDFPGGALSGQIVLEIPYTTFDGTAAAGEVAYSVYLNGEEHTSSSASAGETVNIPLRVPATGEYKVSAVLKNNVGSSPVAHAARWLGPDTPARLPYVNISYDGNGTFTLDWPEARGAHGGWFDPSSVTYTVIRYGDTSQTFNNLTDNTFIDNVPVPAEDEYATYHYSVTVKFGDITGAPTSSEFYTIGSKTPPFVENFNYRWELGKFTILEGENSDNERWNYDSSKAVSLYTFTGYGSDDYLLLPPLQLQAGMVYPISFDIKGKYSYATERIEVLAGMAPAVENLTETILGPTEFCSTEYQNMSMDFSPAADGVYFIAIHAISDPYEGGITIDNIRVGAGETGIDKTTGSGEVAISTGSGVIFIKAPAGEPVIVSDMAGRTILSVISNGSANVAATSGIYVVRAGNKVAKVRVF